MSDTERAAAARCLEDPIYAQQVLKGDALPQVRRAILDDIADATEVQGFFNPQPDPPGAESPIVTQQMCTTWRSLSLINLTRLARS